jgi:hypothetical protein
MLYTSTKCGTAHNTAWDPVPCWTTTTSECECTNGRAHPSLHSNARHRMYGRWAHAAVPGGRPQTNRACTPTTPLQNCAAVPAEKEPTGWFKSKLCTRTYLLPRCAPLPAVSTPLGDNPATTSIESLRQSMLAPPDAIHTTLVQQPCSAQTKHNCSHLAHMLCRQLCISCGCKPQEPVLSYGPGRCCCWHH